MLEKFHDIAEAARLLHLSVPTLRRKVLDGEIDCFRPSGFGRKILFSDEHLKEYVRRHTFRGAEQVRLEGAGAERQTQSSGGG